MVEPGDSGGSGPGGEGGGSEPSPFAPRAAALATAHAERAASVYAPEGDAASRAPGLGALSFADRVLDRYHPEEERGPASRARAWVERAAPPVSWIFPVPWYAEALEALGGGEGEARGRAYVPGAAPAAVRAAELARRIFRAPGRRRDARPFAGALDVVAPATRDVPRPAEDARRRDPKARAEGSAASRALPPSGGDQMGGPEEREAHRRRAAELMLRPAAAMAPAAGPRASLAPSVAAYARAARTRRDARHFEAAGRPLSPLGPERALGFPPRAQSAGASLAASAPAALHHVSWTDRWLARFSGASAAALASFQPREFRPGRLGAGAPEVFVAPAAEPGPGVARGRGERARSPDASPRVPVFGDDERVPDEAFAAIAAAAGGERRGARPASAEAGEGSGRARGEAPSPPRAQAPPADRLLARSAGVRGAGLAPELGASPLSPLFEGLVLPRPDRIADTRMLAPARRGASAASGRAEILASMRGAPTIPVAAEPPHAGELRALAARAPAAIGLELERGAGGSRGAPATGALEVPAFSAAQRTIAASSSATAPAGAPAAGAEAPGSSALGAAAGRPGALSAGAAAFAQERSLAAGDLALDFVAPELVVAAREYGFGPAEAARAARLAASEPRGLEELAARVESALEARIEHSAGAGGGGLATSETRWPERAAGPAAGAKTRGASLWPRGVAEALKLRAEGADGEHPRARAALELLAASAVVAAGQSEAPAAGAALASGAAGGASHAELAAMPPSGSGARGAGQRRFAEGGWPVFAHAARALAEEFRNAPGGSVSAQARAAAAWSSLPQVIPGGGGGEPAPAPERAAPASSAPSRRVPAEIPELVRTGGPAEESPRRGEGGGEGSIPSWVEDAARRVLAEQSGGDGGVSMAELTLVTAAPTRHVAASPRRPSSGKAASEVSRPDAKPAGAAEPPQGPDVEELAREVYDHIRRMLAVARERSGEPWRR